MIFNVVIEKDENGYFANVLELEGCVSQGDTYEETLKNIKEALELYIETLSDDEKKEIKKIQTISITPLEVAI